MHSNKDESKTKMHCDHDNKQPVTDLSILKTCLSGIMMGFIAYSGSFSAVPILFTITALIFGPKSLITTFATAFGQLLAGYLHTHSSRTGMALSTKFFDGFYISKSTMKNRRKYDETKWQSVKRFFILHPLNAFVLNLMWETFTFYYLLQSELFMSYVEGSDSNKMHNERTKSTNELGPRLLLIHGITRYLAGCLSGMSTGMINHLWQRHLAHKKIPCAIFNTNKTKLKLEWNERKKLLSPLNMENWVKVSTMILGALFIIASNVPNITGLHLLNLRQKKMINDILVIHGGWFYIRDCQMLLFKKCEKAPVVVEQAKLIEDEQSNTPPAIA
jgi:hypothetical protein